MESKTEARREGAEAPYETKEEETRSVTARRLLTSRQFYR